MEEAVAAKEAEKIFEREIGASGVKTQRTLSGDRSFLKFVIGREAPIYSWALRETQKSLPLENPFKGVLGLSTRKTERFPESLEATVLLTLITRSTRAVSEDTSERGFSVPYVPFQNHEDHQLAQPASHVVVGRRGVGKSTLIRRAVEILRASSAVVAVIDVQAYSALTGDDLKRELLQDILSALVEDVPRAAQNAERDISTDELEQTRLLLSSSEKPTETFVPQIKRNIQAVTKAAGSSAYIFLDDFHLLEWDEQPKVLHTLHGTFKGANGWIKVAGLRSLLDYYSAQTREGLQASGRRANYFA